MPDDLSRWWPLLAGGLLLYAAMITLVLGPGKKLLPLQYQLAVPWTAVEVILVVFLMVFFWPAFAALLVTSTGLGDLIYGHDVMAAVRGTEAGVNVSRDRVGLLFNLVALPFQVLTIPLLLWRVSGTRPYQLGLTLNRAGWNALLGVLGWLLVTPVVLGINQLATHLFSKLTPEVVTEHAFERLATSGTLTPVELGLVIFIAVVSAPLVEELLFRGVLLRWLAPREWGGHLAMGVALLVALPAQPEKWNLLRDGPGWQVWVQVLAPVLFVLLLIPAYLCVHAWQKTPFPTALFGTSLIFATVHSAWPSPVPLFVLALGLGWLAQRTQSLVGPIVLHSLFNGIACVQMLSL